MASALRYEGWDVETAADGLSAVRAGREFRPDAVVLEVMLPDFGGMEVRRRLRAEPLAVCVLFLTARESVEDPDRRHHRTRPGSQASAGQDDLSGRSFGRAGTPYTTGQRAHLCLGPASAHPIGRT